MSSVIRLRRRRLRAPAACAVLTVGVAAVLAAGCGGERSSDRTSPESTTAETADTAPTDTAPTDNLSPDTSPAETTRPTDRASELLDAACADALAVDSLATLPDHLTSVSGLVASRRHPGVVWAIEDSLEPPVVSAITLDGQIAASIRLVGRPLMNLDWEDVAIGPGPDGRPWIHVADIGDNFGLRPAVQVHRFPEPALSDTSVTPETVEARYEDGRPNAEALVVDRDGGIWVVDKNPDGPATIHLLDGDGVFRAQGTVDLPGEQVTAADLSPDSRVLALRTLGQVRLYALDEHGDVMSALGSEPCLTPAPDERQGESVAFVADGDGLLTVSEDESGAPVDLHLIGPAPGG